MTHTTTYQGSPPWAWHSTSDGWASPEHLICELTDRDRVCFNCPLPECNQASEWCPFNDNRTKAKRDRTTERRVYRLAQRIVDEELQAAMEAANGDTA